MPITIGKKYGHLTVLKKADPVIRYRGDTGWRQTVTMVECLCECSKTIITQAGSVVNGTSKSCGCIKIKHSLSNHPLYNVWTDIKKRCYNKNHLRYHRYGGRGISVCRRWLQFKNFYDDMINGYKKGLTLDRIDNNGNYEPSNCRWATIKTQANNTSTTTIVEYKSQNIPLTIACEMLGLKTETIRNRIHRFNMTFMEAIKMKKYSRRKII